MKIALVTSSFLPQVGGAEIVVHNLAVQWAKQGHHVCVINGISDKPTHLEANYRVMKFLIPRGSTRFGYHRFPFSRITERSLKKCLEVFNPDAISGHFGYPVGYWLSQLKPLPKYTITCHGGEITPLDWGDLAVRKCDKQLYSGLSNASKVIAISKYCCQWFKKFGVSDEKIANISNGVDVTVFGFKANFNLREQFCLPKESRIVLSVGREHSTKDFQTAIHAFAKIAEKEKDTYYVLVGKGVGIHRQLSLKLGVSDRVVLCDEGLYGEQLVGAYQQADVLLSSSVWELQSLIVLEGLAAGLPEVVTDVSGSSDVIENGVNGFIVEPGNPEQMAASLMAILSNPQMQQAIRQNNLLKARRYDWDQISREYLKYMK